MTVTLEIEQAYVMLPARVIGSGDATSNREDADLNGRSPDQA